MAEQKLLVKREGDFHYPIYFEKDFSGSGTGCKGRRTIADIKFVLSLTVT